MHLLIVTDIFGRTSCTDTLMASLSDRYVSMEIIDPYKGVEIDFASETEAYEYFQTTIGLNGYIDKLLHHLRTDIKDCGRHLLGFSVGGSALWAASAEFKSEQSIKGICFYSSQIRNFLHLKPQWPIDLYFPKSEAHFEVKQVIEALSSTPRVQCITTPFLHGFMNEKSVNYNSSGYKQHLSLLRTIEFWEKGAPLTTTNP